MSIKEYFKKTKAQKQINKLAQKYKNKKIVIYGAGEYFNILNENYDISQLNIVAICDKKFESSTNLNTTKYFPITPNDLKTFDHDAVLVCLYDDSSLIEYLEYDLLINTKNENKKIESLIKPTISYILNLFLFENKEIGNKKIIIKKIKRELLFFKKAKYRKLINENIKTIEFLYEIIDFTKIPTEIQTKLNINFENFKILKENYKKANKIKQLQNIHKNLVILLKPLTNLNSSYLKLCQEKNLRKYQLDSVKYCKEICDFINNNNLNYFITSGTLIGLLRHNGFIPWDDDIDIGMLRQDYEKLKIILEKNFIKIDTSKIFQHKQNKIKILDETIRKNPNKILYLITHYYIQIIKGTSVEDCLILDIFPHDFYSENYTPNEHFNFFNKIKIKINSISNWQEKYDYIQKEIKNNQNLSNDGNKIFYGIDSLDSHLFSIQDFMTKDIIFPLKKVVFEGKEFFAPNKMEKYIEFQYKNWQSLPSKIEIAPDLTERLNYNSKHFL